MGGQHFISKQLVLFLFLTEDQLNYIFFLSFSGILVLGPPFNKEKREITVGPAERPFKREKEDVRVALIRATLLISFFLMWAHSFSFSFSGVIDPPIKK